MSKLASLFNNRAPYHVLLYSLIFGTSTFHSFISAPIAFKVLPRKEFGALQNKIFPGYFLAQSITPALLYLTAPYALCPVSIGILGITSITGLANYLILLPWCQKVKNQRFKLENDKLDKQIVDGQEVPSEQMAKLNKEFGKAHGISTLTNILSIFALTAYGFFLSNGLLRYIPK